ncbi:MAG: hypothetical protein ABGX37_00390 [Methylococcales bacterium]
MLVLFAELLNSAIGRLSI